MAERGTLLRQWILLRQLAATRRGLSVDEMARETGVSTKTIRRDLQTLTLAGFPLVETRAERGRKLWRLPVPNQQPPLAFNFAELASLYLARQLLEPLAGTLFWESAQSALAKIRTCVGPQALEYLSKLAESFWTTKFGISDYRQRAELVDALMIAIEDRKVTTLRYCSRSAQQTHTYDVHPYGLVYHRGSLYLVAWAVPYQEVRHYKVDRIRSVDVRDQKFERPANFDLQRHLTASFGIFQGKGRGYRVQIRFSPDVAMYVSESLWHPSQRLAALPDGGLLAEFRLGALEEVKQWVLSFGQHAEVLEPEELRQQIVDDLRQTLAHYTAPERVVTAARRSARRQTLLPSQPR